MTYADVDMVKQRLRIGTTDTSRDSQINAALDYADAYADSIIEANGGSTPISSPPKRLKEGVADIAAYFLYRSDKPDVATLFKESGDMLIQNYVVETLYGADARRSGRSGVLEE